MADDAPVAAAEILETLGEARGAGGGGAAPPWGGIAATARIREELGFRPDYPSLRAARRAGAL